MLIIDKPRIAIVGATGAVGQELLQLMSERNFQYKDLALVASARSEGKIINYRNKKLKVFNLETFDFSQYDIAFFSAGTSISKLWAKKAADQGALVIDNTNAFRIDAGSPLVVPQVNGNMLIERPRTGIIANPNCSTIQMVRVLKPIDELFNLERVIVSTYQAASGGGSSGMIDLQEDANSFMKDSKQQRTGSSKFPKPLAFNVVPQVDVLMENGFTLEEQKMVQESRKILDLPRLRLTATAVRVPVINGHSEAVYLETKNEIDLSQTISALKNSSEIKVYGDSEADLYPTPRFLKSQNDVHVGRLRIDPDNPHGLWCWIVANNLRVGAALNALQIAETVCGTTKTERKEFSHAKASSL